MVGLHVLSTQIVFLICCCFLFSIDGATRTSIHVLKNMVMHLYEEFHDLVDNGRRADFSVIWIITFGVPLDKNMNSFKKSIGPVFLQ